MLDRTTRTIALIVVVATASVAVASLQSFDLRAALATLPDLPGSPSEARGVSSLSSYDASSTLLRDAMLEPNAERLEARLDGTLDQLGSGGRGRQALPSELVGLAGHPVLRSAHRTLDGVPRRELEIATFVEEPDRAFDPWHVEVVIDVRAIDGNAPGFRAPSTTLTLELRPYGHAGSRIVERWAVERATFTRGGVFSLAPEITYVRRGAIAVAAPAGETALARESADFLVGLHPKLQRRYPDLGWSEVAFVALVPSRSAAADVFAWDESEMEGAIGYAKGTRHMALLLDEMHAMDDLGRRDLLRHELTHLVTGQLTATGWNVYVEGLAEWEGNHEVVADGRFFIINGPAVDMVDSGEVDMDELLFEPDGFEQFGDDTYAGYRLGMLVSDYLTNVHGHETALRFYRAIADGTHPRIAVRRVLQLSPGRFRTDVVAWMRSHRDWD